MPRVEVPPTIARGFCGRVDVGVSTVPPDEKFLMLDGHAIDGAQVQILVPMEAAEPLEQAIRKARVDTTSKLVVPKGQLQVPEGAFKEVKNGKVD